MKTPIAPKTATPPVAPAAEAPVKKRVIVAPIEKPVAPGTPALVVAVETDARKKIAEAWAQVALNKEKDAARKAEEKKEREALAEKQKADRLALKAERDVAEVLAKQLEEENKELVRGDLKIQLEAAEAKQVEFDAVAKTHVDAAKENAKEVKRLHVAYHGKPASTRTKKEGAAKDYTQYEKGVEYTIGEVAFTCQDVKADAKGNKYAYFKDTATKKIRKAVRMYDVPVDAPPAPDAPVVEPTEEM